MADWLRLSAWAMAFLAVAVAGAWLGRRYGRQARGNLALAGILLGLGEALDPPPRNRVEAAEAGKDQPGPGEPPTPD